MKKCLLLLFIFCFFLKIIGNETTITVTNNSGKKLTLVIGCLIKGKKMDSFDISQPQTTLAVKLIDYNCQTGPSYGIVPPYVELSLKETGQYLNNDPFGHSINLVIDKNGILCIQSDLNANGICNIQPLYSNQQSAQNQKDSNQSNFSYKAGTMPVVLDDSMQAKIKQMSNDSSSTTNTNNKQSLSQQVQNKPAKTKKRPLPKTESTTKKSAKKMKTVAVKKQILHGLDPETEKYLYKLAHPDLSGIAQCNLARAKEYLTTSRSCPQAFSCEALDQGQTGKGLMCGPLSNVQPDPQGALQFLEKITPATPNEYQQAQVLIKQAQALPTTGSDFFTEHGIFNPADCPPGMEC